MIGKWTRERGFGRGSRGSKWWIARVNHDGNVNEEIRVTASGREIIEVLEVIPTKTCGELAIYKHWVADPDGAESMVSWLPHSDEINFRSVAGLSTALRTMGGA
jgi:hypothetical protein